MLLAYIFSVFFFKFICEKEEKRISFFTLPKQETTRHFQKFPVPLWIFVFFENVSVLLLQQRGRESFVFTHSLRVIISVSRIKNRKCYKEMEKKCLKNELMVCESVFCVLWPVFLLVLWYETAHNIHYLFKYP